jgi:ABC-type protease/lipase transport system fused ATPase/permease subunit
VASYDNINDKMNKELKYWIYVIILSYLPTIGFHFIIRPMWYKGVDYFTDATTMETLFTIIFMPLYLVVTNYLLFKKHNKTNISFIINCIIILSCVFISTSLHFKNWADSIGSWDNPDTETIMVMNFERTAGIVVSVIGLTIVFVRLWNKNKKQTLFNTQDLTK